MGAVRLRSLPRIPAVSDSDIPAEERIPAAVADIPGPDIAVSEADTASADIPAAVAEHIPGSAEAVSPEPVLTSHRM